MKKLLIITPHLSTGGLPQFLLEKIEILFQNYDIYLIEYENITGGAFVVQRNKLQSILQDKLFTLENNKNEILDIINSVKPDIIHFEEFSESFIDVSILKQIYLNKNYKITETTHGTFFNKDLKQFIPDKMMFVSKGNYNQYYSLVKDSEVIEYPIKNNKREETLLKLGLNPYYKHVLNVGLFNSNKNQGEVIEYAKFLEQSGANIMFHFIGNQAVNFESYWKPLIDNLPSNCKIWGEREDVENFYKGMDLLLYTSILENRPLSVLEALNYDMPVLMYNLTNYADDFAKHKNVEFLTKDFNSNLKLILKKLNIEYYTKKEINTENIEEIFDTYETVEEIFDTHETIENKSISAYHILTDIETDREIRSMQDLTKLKKYGINYNMIISKRYTDMPPVNTCAFPEIVSMEPGGKLTPGHYGCYLGHRNAFETGLQNNSDYMLIFECDCILDVTHKEFVDYINKACEIIERDDLLMFSLGFHNDQGIVEEKDDYYIVDHFIGAHAYIIPKKSYSIINELYKNTKWNVTDLFFANNLRNYKQGIFKTPITKQAGGISILENEKNEDRY